MSRLGPSPFGRVAPDDPPEAYCSSCEIKYNPYKTGLRCPKCEA